MNLQQRLCGVLLPLSSLPGASCCGGLGAGARRFADFLQRAGQRWWQMLPLNPIDECFSPYAGISTFAADPIYIDLEDLVKEGLLDPEDLIEPPEGPVDQTDYDTARDYRMGRLYKAFLRYIEQADGTKYHAAYESFLADNMWVSSHAEFCVRSEKYGTIDWTQWPEEPDDPDALDAALGKIDEDAAEYQIALVFHTFLQLLFDVQWKELHDYCRERGIGLIGDVPIYVSKNSVDTWTFPHLFQLDESGNMPRIAGAPADSFNPDGQRWNSPLYDWDALRNRKYSWWIYRLRTALRRFDAVRLDHFIGFYNYFSMTPEPDPDDPGHWVPGPADEFFETILREIPDAQFIAEDLGVMKQGVHDLRDKFGFPGINVFQFCFDHRLSHDPTVAWKKNSVVCTGTHDTNTLTAWIDEVLKDAQKGDVPYWNLPFILEMLQPFAPNSQTLDNPETIRWAIIRKVMSSPGNVAVFPMQDLLGLSAEARMNFPGHADGNWTWRLDESLLTDELADKLRTWIDEFGRM